MAVPEMMSSASRKERLRHLVDRILEQRWINIGLRAKMSLLIEVGLVGLIAIFLFVGVSNARQSTRQILNERMMLARLSAATLDSNLRHIRSVLLIVASRNVLRDPVADEAQVQAVLDEAFDQISVASQGIYLLDETGRPRYAANRYRLNINWSDLPVFQQPLADENRVYVNMLSTSHPWAVQVAPVYSYSGQQTGWLAAVLDFDSADLAPFRSVMDLGKSGTLELVEADGRVLISSQPNRVRLNSTPDPLVGKFFVAGRPMVETCLGCAGSDPVEGSDEVLAFAPLSQAPWGVVVRQKAGELMAPVNSLLVQTLLLGAVTIGGALALVWATTASVIRPVQTLKEAADRISAGDFTTPMEALSSGWLSGRRKRKDEIGHLADSFESMRRQLKRSMDEIQALNRDLDGRVQERTRDARQAQLEAQAARDDLRAVIDALDDELIVVDATDHSILQVNRAAERNHACTERFVGEVCDCLCCPGGLEGRLAADRRRSSISANASPDCPLPRVLQTGETVRVTHVCTGPTESHSIYKEITASPLRDIDGRISRVVELTRDVSEEKRVKASLIRRNQQLSILNAIATTVNQSLNLEDILERSLDAVLRLTEVDVGAVFLLDDVLGVLKLMAQRGLSQQAAQLAAELGMLDGSCGGVIDHGALVVVPDLARYRGRRARSLQRENLTTLVHVPLTAKGCVLGSMCIGTHKLHEFDPEEQELLTALGSQIAVAIENARLYAEVQHKERMRGELFKKAVNAQDEERRRIARELHDETSQSLTALLFAAETTRGMKSMREARKQLDQMGELLQHTLDGVHKIIFDLRPSMLDHLGLVPAIRSLAKARLEARGVRVTVQEIGQPHRLSPEMETALYRVAQEAISNIARHAAARNVSITWALDGPLAELAVQDDGIGFDLHGLTVMPDSPRGLGLMGMQERLELLGGEVEIMTFPGNGTLLKVRVPLNGGDGSGVDA